MPKEQILADYSLQGESFRHSGLRFIRAQSESQRDVLIGFKTARAIAWPQVFCALQASGISLKLDKSQTGQIAIVCETRGSTDDLSVQIVNALDSMLKNATTRRHFFADKGWLLPSRGTAAPCEEPYEEPDTSVASSDKSFWSKRRKLTLAITLLVVAMTILALTVTPSLTFGFESKGKTTPPNGASAKAFHVSHSKQTKSSPPDAYATKRLSTDQVAALLADCLGNSRTIAGAKISIKQTFEKLGVTVAFERSLNFGGITQVVLDLPQVGQSFAIQLEKSSGAYTVVKCRELK